MRSNFVTILLCGFASLNCSVYAQQWGGANDQTSAISRTGSISTGSINVSGNNSNFIGPDINVSRTSTAEGVGKGVALQLNDIGSGTHSMIQHSPGGLQFFNFNGSMFLERMRISTNGNVGIGTTAPLTKIQIMDVSNGGAPTSTIPNQGLLISGNSTVGSLNMGIDAIGSFYSWIQSRHRENNSTYALALNPSGGNVGVGTSSPQAKLHIYGGRGLVEHATEASIQYKATTISQYWDVGTNNLGYYIYENSSQKYNLVVNKNGNVGIGTTDPKSFKLSVNGKVWATEVQVALTIPGPDYVFEESYNLPSLTDTENYIKQNKHLPEVPSACEMEENGINLSEMNMILLKKVEELTLYLLKQNKTIAEQNERLLKLENKN